MNYINIVLTVLNLAPGYKTKIAAIAAFALAIVAAWNGMAPQLGIDFTIQIPEFVNAAVLALLGVGVANAENNTPKP